MAKTLSRTLKGFCPQCDASVTVGRHVRVGDRLNCPQCVVGLEVLSLSPFELDYADSEEWEEDREEQEWEEEDWEEGGEDEE